MHVWVPIFVYGGAMAAIVVGLLHGRGRLRGFAMLTAVGAFAALWIVNATLLFWFGPITMALAAVLAAGVVRFQIWKMRGLVLTAVLGGLAATWYVGDVLADRGWRDVDGWIDCWPSCNRWHLLGVLLHLGPAVVATVVIAVVAATAVVEQHRAGLRSGAADS